MSGEFRVIDSGVADGRRQIAFDQALIELHKAGRIPDTVRFLRFPPTVLIGRHQVLSHEVRLDYCKANNIGLARRISGGGTIYLDEGQLGWELVFRRHILEFATLQDYAQKICKAVANGLSENFGVRARFRGRNDIEVDGRKLCGTGGFYDGDSIIYQGTVLVDMDPSRMVACLNVPEAKLEKRKLDSAEQRVVTLNELLGKSVDIAEVQNAVLEGLSNNLDISTYYGTVSEEEKRSANQCWKDEIGLDEFVDEIKLPDGGKIYSASIQTKGGLISTSLRLDGRQDRIREILFAGDFFVAPPRTVFDLEARLRGIEQRNISSVINNFFANSEISMLTLRPEDFVEVIELAIASAC